jgi:ABC-type phosphate transport system substrate-binding protein
VFSSQIKKTVLQHSRISVITLILTCLLAFSQSSLAETSNLVINGSTTILPIARSIAEKFEHQCENVTVKPVAAVRPRASLAPARQ